MKRWLILFLVIIATMISPMLTVAAKTLPICPVCGLYGVKTGQATYQFGKFYVQYKCAYNHTWWEQE